MVDRTSTDVLLEVVGVQKRFGSTQALQDARLTVRGGEVHALLGGNGAGKSTLISIIAGAAPPDAGEVRVRGAATVFGSPRDALARGIAVVYQELSALPHLTVAENIGLGNPALRRRGVFRWARARRAAAEALTLLGEHAATIDPEAPMVSLRADQQQLVEIARAVTLGATVVLLDEPTSSLNHDEIERLFAVVRELGGRGIGFVFVSHRLREVRQVCDRVTVLREGQTVLDGVDLSTVDNGTVIEAMLGRSLSRQLTHAAEGERLADESLKDAVLETKPLTPDGRPIRARSGEIIGIAGLAGSGRSALLRQLWGSDARPRPATLQGKPYKPRSPHDAMAHGVAYVGEDRALDGVFLDLPIGETLMAPLRVLRGGRLRLAEEGRLVERIVDVLDVKVTDPATPARALSGGNQQKLLFGRWLTTSPSLVLLDEPTRGVDLHTKAELYELVRRLAMQGAAILLVSSELAELATLASRTYVIEAGDAVDELPGSSSEDELLAAVAARAVGEEIHV
jgi:ABC-type sugar transport system ATPase subunit